MSHKPIIGVSSQRSHHYDGTVLFTRGMARSKFRRTKETPKRSATIPARNLSVFVDNRLRVLSKRLLDIQLVLEFFTTLNAPATIVSGNSNRDRRSLG
ncbi:hypothetical protein WN48_11056 [Eufriesea mexicana]|nr:hypothetical protein WN48_11056 [Eufriesea mexicana]